MTLPSSSPAAPPAPAVNPSRLAALFDELCDLPAAEAQARLAAACGDDVRLRAAVAELLDHDRAAGDSFLARGALSLGGLAGAARATGPTADEAPRARLGRYAVEGKLGQGGMGVVYVGYDERLDRRVALKLLQRNIHLSHRWLLREGQALARLAHPNVVGVYDIGEEDDRVFLAMELVEGPTLRTWLAERPRAAMDVIRVHLQAAYGLAAAHEAGIIHRDFKPDNVLIGKDGRPRVMDFGIAALSDASAASESPPGTLVGDLAALPSAAAQRPAVSLLKSGIIGTPDYMAPELLAGERATAESDQWAFCMALYRAVYQMPPSAVPASGHRSGAAGPAAGPRELVVPSRAGVPGWLHPILARGLSVDRRDRYPSMQALIDALERELATDPQMDPRRVSKERRDLGLAFLISTALQGLPVLLPFMRPWATRPVVLAECAAVTTLLVSVAVFVHWQVISGTRYGMQLRGLFPLTVGVQLFHRLFALRLGTTAEQILTQDLFLWTMCFATTGVLLAPFVLVLAGGVAMILVLVAFNLLSVYLAWGGAALCVVVSMAVRLWVDRDRAPSPRSPGPSDPPPV